MCGCICGLVVYLCDLRARAFFNQNVTSQKQTSVASASASATASSSLSLATSLATTQLHERLERGAVARISSRAKESRHYNNNNNNKKKGSSRNYIKGPQIAGQKL